MPSRILPKSHTTRRKTLNKCNLKGGTTATKPFPAALWTKLNYTTPGGLAASYITALDLVDERGQASGAATDIVQSSFAIAAEMISHYFQVLDMAIDRGVFSKDIREYHHRDKNIGIVPDLDAYDDIPFWGDHIANGEAQRQIDEGAGYLPLAFPSREQVAAACLAFKNARIAQAPLSESLTLAEQAVELLIPGPGGIDKLILDLYNETEHTYRDHPPGAMRDLCRAWGLIYEGDPDDGDSGGTPPPTPTPMPTPTPTPSPTPSPTPTPTPSPT